MDIYENIGKRTGGDIYIGVVGPVRVGKSTFIKRFMDLMVIPKVENQYEKQRILDEMPQSGTGKTITTTEPKFIPAEAARIHMGHNMNMKVRLVDCVGYLVPGVVGHMEEDVPRMVATPWSEEKMPFEEAAEMGTEKVIRDHSTIGLVITTDGSIETMDRSSYVNAEERVIEQLKELKKPFVVILNSRNPKSGNTVALAEELENKYGVPVMAMDCARASEEKICGVMERLLGCFPVKEVEFQMPGYVEGLENGHWLKSGLMENIRFWAQSFDTVSRLQQVIDSLRDGEIIESIEVNTMDMGTGRIRLRLNLAENLYYKVITELMEENIENDYQFFSILKEFSEAKRAYDKLKGAMEQVESRGYGIVEPKLSEMILDEPQVFKQGNKYGVKIRAKAPTLHIIKTDITTEVSPVVGSEKQSEDLVASLKEDMDNSPNGIWDTNIFGKSLYDMVTEQMGSKIASVPDNIRIKMQKSLQKISDEGKEYFICIVI